MQFCYRDPQFKQNQPWTWEIYLFVQLRKVVILIKSHLTNCTCICILGNAQQFVSRLSLFSYLHLHDNLQVFTLTNTDYFILNKLFVQSKAFSMVFFEESAYCYFQKYEKTNKHFRVYFVQGKGFLILSVGIFALQVIKFESLACLKK